MVDAGVGELLVVPAVGRHDQIAVEEELVVDLALTVEAPPAVEVEADRRDIRRGRLREHGGLSLPHPEMTLLELGMRPVPAGPGPEKQIDRVALEPLPRGKRPGSLGVLLQSQDLVA